MKVTLYVFETPITSEPYLSIMVYVHFQLPGSKLLSYNRAFLDKAGLNVDRLV